MLSNTREIIGERLVKFSYITVLALIFFSILSYLNSNMLALYVDAGIAILLMLNIRTKLPVGKKVFIFICLGFFLLTFLIYYSVIDTTGWLWSLVFPAFIFLLNEIKKSILWTVSFGVMLLFILLLQNLSELKTAYSNYELFVFIFVYGLISILIYLFKKDVDLYTIKLIEFNSSLESRVKEEVQKNKLQDKIINNQVKQVQMGEMVSMIAHQWRQPLNSISASAIRLKLENDMDLSSKESVDEISIFIQNQTQDMSEIINNFLDFAKPVRDGSEFKLSLAIDKVFRIINMQLELHSIIVKITYDKGFSDKFIKGSENLFEQVLLNLLANIRDAYDENISKLEKNIFIDIDKIGNIGVKDYAGGIDSKIIDKVFNPYFTTKEQGKGTGLGLYMSRKIMREHFNGDLIYTPLDGGSCFKIVFARDLTKELSNV
ncbi:MAG: HAMP domain-containing sensor histidine kinase [Campylobacterota bacterium]|nr:HAMP domain-containing sensor histidine kinase [Campylobacterota bacterium]